MKQSLLKLLLVFLFCVSIILVGFAQMSQTNNSNHTNKPNQPTKSVKQDGCNQYTYTSNGKQNINVIIYEVYRDSNCMIEILQIKGHEYIIYHSKHKASVAMVHSASCYLCVENKNNE